MSNILQKKLLLTNGKVEFISSAIRLSHIFAAFASLWQPGKPSWQSTVWLNLMVEKRGG
jgi:hypothetical protein